MQIIKMQEEKDLSKMFCVALMGNKNGQNKQGFLGFFYVTTKSMKNPFFSDLTKGFYYGFILNVFHFGIIFGLQTSCIGNTEYS